MAEQVAVNHKVPGSSPGAGANSKGKGSMATILNFPSNKIFRRPKNEVTLMRHKKTGVIHRLDFLNDDYLYCGYLMWPNFERFEEFTGSKHEVTCKKCMFNKPFMPHF